MSMLKASSHPAFDFLGARAQIAKQFHSVTIVTIPFWHQPQTEPQEAINPRITRFETDVLS